MKSFVSKVQRQLSKFLNYIVAGYFPRVDENPEDWWRFYLDYMEY